MMRDVHELWTQPAREDGGERLTDAEFIVYRRGYEHALLIALKVLDAAVGNWYRYRKDARKKAVAKTKARGVA